MIKYGLFILALSLASARCADAPAASLPANEEEVVSPRPLKMVKPVYPPELADQGVRAEVLLEIVIDAQGRVEKATVLKSNNPAFDEPSIKAMLAWTFLPATHKGVPVPITATQGINFYIQDDPGGGVDLFVVKPSKRSKDTAARRHVSPKPAGVVQAVYPHPMLLEKKSGKANVELSVDKRGRVVNVQVLKASAPEFGFAASAAAGQFTFKPATAVDLPVESIVSVDVKFEFSGENSLVLPPDKRLLKLEAKKPDQIINARQLDQPLKIISQKAAIFPVSLRTQFSQGEAVVEFLIDEKGAVALPRIISADAPEFGYAAVQAVSVWLFEPPVSKGEKVITKAKVPFKFKYAPSASAD